MGEFTLSVIHLGNSPAMDVMDGNSIAENQAALMGTYYDAADPASHHIATIVAQDVNNDNRVSSNDAPVPEPVTFDIGAGPVATQYDALFNADVTVTFDPGSGEPDYNGLGGVIQTETGDLFFVMIDDDAGLGANSFDNFPIVSITVNSISVFGSQSAPQFSDGQSFVRCFATGTQIRTPQGFKSVEEISAGDWVETLDSGRQQVTWVSRRSLSARQLAARPKLRAIHIAAGALGDGHPAHDLVVSPQHRVLLRSKIVQRMTDQPEIIVPAVKLVGFPGIQQLNCGLGVQYHHFTCAAHELVWANGAPAETLYLGRQVQQGLSPAASAELGILLPEEPGGETLCIGEPVRPIVQRRLFLKNMLARHMKNDMQLVTT